MKTASKKAAGTTAGERTTKAGRPDNTADHLINLAGMITPSEHKIRELAEAIYRERAGRGEPGTPEEDWRKAEEILTMME